MPRILTAQDIQALGPGSMLELEAGTRLTALALEQARARRVRLHWPDQPPVGEAALAKLRESINRSGPLALGADHAGFVLKQALRARLIAAGQVVIDLGVFSPEPADYPDIAAKVARAVAAGECARGLLIDGAGVGSAIAANKIRGARAAFCPDAATARNSREHNGANILCLGAKQLDPAAALAIITTFLETSLSEPRHLRRVAKILALEGQAEFRESGA
jgi:ribose 5-phosphate isomerase B